MTEVETLVSSSLEVLSRNVSSYFWSTSPPPSPPAQQQQHELSPPRSIPPPPPPPPLHFRQQQHLHELRQRQRYLRANPASSSSNRLALVTSPPKRRVRFADERGQPLEQVSYCVPSRKKLTLVDRNRLWLDAAELQSSKLQIGDLCRKLRDQGLSDLLTETVRSSSGTTNHNHNNNNKAQMKLDRWVIQGAPLRGLERHVNRQHGQERDQLRTQCVKAIMEAQRRMRQNGESSPEFLAKVSYALSQASRELALKLASADERAMALMLQEDRRLYLHFARRGQM